MRLACCSKTDFIHNVNPSARALLEQLGNFSIRVRISAIDHETNVYQGVDLMQLGSESQILIVGPCILVHSVQGPPDTRGAFALLARE